MEPWSQSHPGWRGGERPTLATFPSLSSILSFVGNKQTHNCRTDQASLLLVRVRCQMAALCSGQLSFKQRFRHAASFHLVALLSPAHGFQGRPALLYQAREKGKHTEGCKWKDLLAKPGSRAYHMPPNSTGQKPLSWQCPLAGGAGNRSGELLTGLSRVYPLSSASIRSLHSLRTSSG